VVENGSDETDVGLVSTYLVLYGPKSISLIVADPSPVVTDAETVADCPTFKLSVDGTVVTIQGLGLGTTSIVIFALGPGQIFVAFAILFPGQSPVQAEGKFPEMQNTVNVPSCVGVYCHCSGLEIEGNPSPAIADLQSGGYIIHP
jgi:hypothetical protein